MENDFILEADLEDLDFITIYTKESRRILGCTEHETLAEARDLISSCESDNATPDIILVDNRMDRPIVEVYKTPSTPEETLEIFRLLLDQWFEGWERGIISE